MGTEIDGDDIQDLSITDADVDPANKDGAVSVPSLRTLGEGTQQAAPGNNPQGFDWNAFKHRGASPMELWYVAGLAGSDINTGTPATLTLMALPLVNPLASASLKGLGVSVSNNSSGRQFRLGLYTSVSLTNLYPSSLLYDSGPLGMTVNGSVKTPVLNVPLVKNALYWVVSLFSSAAPVGGTRIVPVASLYPILGISSNLASAPGMAWTVAAPWAALPATFPSGASVVTSGSVPMLAYLIG